MKRISRRRALGYLGSLLPAGSILSACSDEKGKPPAQRPEEPDAARNVVLIVVDTLKASTLGCYGYDLPCSPAIDGMAEESIVFDRFHAACPWTAPSFGSILTGTTPAIHGAGRKLDPSNESDKKRINSLADELTSFPQLLKGMRRAAIVNNIFLGPKMGYARGFDHYDHHPAKPIEMRSADQVTELASSWLAANAGDPFFLMVHYFDPHVAYNPPRRIANRFTDAEPKRFGNPMTRVNDIRNGRVVPDEEEKRYIRALYDAEVRFTDDQIGELMQRMEKLDLLGDSWVILTSDHGEEHWEHGTFEHGHRYEAEVTHVPLILRPPGGRWKAGSRIAQSARHIDLAPTFFEMLGREVSHEFEGASLLPLIRGEEKQHRPCYMENNLYRGDQCALLLEGRYKIVRDLNSKTSYMYDLENDPREQAQLGYEHPRYAEMVAALDAKRAELAKRAVFDSKTVDLDPETVESLRGLGYVE
jgi:arylsulfatase A-like enzyme